MSATPLIPGYVYRVRIQGVGRIVIADNPVDAILKILDEQAQS